MNTNPHPLRVPRQVLTVSDAGVGAGHAQDDAARLLAHGRGLTGDELRFHRFTPTASIGRHQALEREVRLSHCTDRGIGVVRRITAGGALYLDPGQQCFSLVVPKLALGDTVADRLRRGAEMVQAGLARLGVETLFKAPNDLQVAGRQKIASVFLAEADDSVLLFGTLLVELDIAGAMKALLVPTEKLTVTGLEHARERMTDLATVMGRVPEPGEIQTALAAAAAAVLNAVAVTSPLPAVADALPMAMLPWPVAGDTFETKDKVEGATLRVALTLAADETVTALRFATDGHFSPQDALNQLAAALHGTAITDVAGRARDWLYAHPLDAAGFGATDVARLIDRAAAKRGLQRLIGLTPEQASGVMLAGSGADPQAALARASVMLVPYCAKPNWCKWRHTIDCVECGLCEVGDAYTLARERNMEVITITNFEHLAETLGKMKDAGVQSYVGMCCGDFFLKRHHAFRDSGMDAVLLDIEGATCYELNEEHLAYAGAFKAEARLDLEAVTKVMAQVPVNPARPAISGVEQRPGEAKYRERAAACGGACACKTGAAES
jgi:lipoate-protein ligase A